jgi:hypothetical protein
MTSVLSDAGGSVARHPWMATLVSVLGVYEILLSINTGSVIFVSGIVGGLLVIASPWVGRRSSTLGAVLLVLGSLVWAVLAWWSIIAPVIALLALGIGGYVLMKIRRLSHRSA